MVVSIALVGVMLGVTLPLWLAIGELEDEGKRYNRFGNAMLVVGGIATAVGIVLIVRQGRDQPQERQPGVSVTPVALRGGAGLVVTYHGWSW